MLERVIKKETILEECAKEAAELSSACLNTALSIGGDDIYYRSDENTLYADLTDHIASMYVMLNELEKAGIVKSDDIYTIKKHKMKALYSRVGAGEAASSNTDNISNSLSSVAKAIDNMYNDI